MKYAVRAIVTNGSKLLVMHRNKYGSLYYTLIGGGVDDGESLEQALVREVKEETGLTVTGARLVYIENHPEPYRTQYIYLCSVAPEQTVAISEGSEEAMLNRLDADIHTPMWVDADSLKNLAFRTPQLQAALIKGLKDGFGPQPVEL